jgi:hypothetical protein
VQLPSSGVGADLWALTIHVHSTEKHLEAAAKLLG